MLAFDDAPAIGRSRPWRRHAAALEVALIALSVAVTAWLAVVFVSTHDLALDFHHDFWVAGSLVRHGLSPYAWTRRQIAGLVSFPYPAAGALLFVPFSLIPRGVSDPMFAALSLGAGLAALRIVNVRDRRVYALVLLWSPVVNGWQTANLTLLLLCGLAAVWRYRDSPVTVGLLTAVMISVKPVVWPLGLWLLITHRHRAAICAAGFGVAITVVSWATIGFTEVPVWWHLLRLQTDVLYTQGYGLTALAVHFGAGRTEAIGLQILAAAAVTLACRRARRREQASFALAVCLMLVSSPLLDSHYFALLIVPLAIARPRLDRCWVIPLLLWLCPATGVAGWEVVLAWLIAGALACRLIRETAPASVPSHETPTMAPAHGVA